MNIPLHTKAHDAHDSGPPIHLLAAKIIGEVRVPEPQTVIEEIWARATWLGPLMEGILHDKHPDPRLRFIE